MSLREKSSSSSRHLRRDGTGRDETRRDTERKRGKDISRRTAGEEKQRPPRSRKLNPPTRWIGRPRRAVSINKQKLSCYRYEGERVK